jgi:uncharacterized protein YjiS (DUF1127 family)
MAYGKVDLGRADMRVTASVVTRFGTALEAFRAARLRAFEKRAIIDQFSAMDERMLSDIGIARGEIGEVATKSFGETTGLARAIVKFAADAVLAPLADWYGRRATYRELMRLDDHLLRDIGLTRAEIPALIEGKSRAVAATEIRAAAIVDVARPVRRWNRRRASAKTLHRLDNRMLSDIGFVRGDIDDVADELAARSMTAANRNDFQPQAA